MSFSEKMKELGIELPPAPAPAANYVPYVQEGGLLFVAGQVPLGPDGKLVYLGKVGADADQEQGYQSARLCALNALAQVNAASNNNSVSGRGMSTAGPTEKSRP